MSVQQILDYKGGKVIAVRPDAPLRDVTGLLAREKIGTVLVTDDAGHLLGIVSERDIVRALAERGEGVFDLTAGALMTRSVICCTPESPIREMLTLMPSHGIRHLPVVRGGEILGLVSIRDVLAYRMESLEADLSALRQAEAEVLHAKEQAELANRAKTEFLANITHELKTPLNAVIGFSALIAGESYGPLGAPEYREYLEAIESSGRHLFEIVNDILDMSRIETGELKPLPEPVTLPPAIATCVRIVAGRARKAGVAVTVEPCAGLPPLDADARMLKQMLVNLLTNAVKFTPKDGRVSVRAFRDGEGGLRIAVADTGIGIAPENLAKVTRPFQQLDGSTSRRFEGTGLGLALVDAMMRMHGGMLLLESAPGVGTTATLRFPASPAAADAAPARLTA